MNRSIKSSIRKTGFGMTLTALSALSINAHAQSADTATLVTDLSVLPGQVMPTLPAPIVTCNLVEIPDSGETLAGGVSLALPEAPCAGDDTSEADQAERQADEGRRGSGTGATGGTTAMQGEPVAVSLANEQLAGQSGDGSVADAGALDGPTDEQDPEMENLAEANVGDDPQNGQSDNLVQVSLLDGEPHIATVTVGDAGNENELSGFTMDGLDSLAQVNIGDNPDAGNDQNLIQVTLFQDQEMAQPGTEITILDAINGDNADGPDGVIAVGPPTDNNNPGATPPPAMEPDPDPDPGMEEGNRETNGVGGGEAGPLGVAIGGTPVIEGGGDDSVLALSVLGGVDPDAEDFGVGSWSNLAQITVGDDANEDAEQCGSFFGFVFCQPGGPQRPLDNNALQLNVLDGADAQVAQVTVGDFISSGSPIPTNVAEVIVGDDPDEGGARGNGNVVQATLLDGVIGQVNPSDDYQQVAALTVADGIEWVVLSALTNQVLLDSAAVVTVGRNQDRNAESNLIQLTLLDGIASDDEPVLEATLLDGINGDGEDLGQVIAVSGSAVEGGDGSGSGLDDVSGALAALDAVLGDDGGDIPSVPGLDLPNDPSAVQGTLTALLPDEAATLLDGLPLP